MTETKPFAETSCARPLPLESVRVLAMDAFQAEILRLAGEGCRVCALFGRRAGGGVELIAVLADDARSRLHIGRAGVEGNAFPSLAAACPQVQLFEREIAEQFGLEPAGHPWSKPVRFAPPLHATDAEIAAWAPVPGVCEQYRVEGEQVHEVAVGPVHAGVIEPGHFRFQCFGETVHHLEITLGYQHRGIERALLGGPDSRTLHLMETAAGDSTIAHATAYCHAVEALSKRKKPARAQALRAVALELERLANHIGDVGAISGDVGYLPTASYCGRIRGDFLNLSAALCGNRFGRGFVVPGGVGFEVDDELAASLLKKLEAMEKDTNNAIDLLWEDQSVMARLEDTGRLTMAEALELGAVGPAARAAGLPRDVRYDHPTGIYQFVQIPISTYDSGDAFARAFVRKMEIGRSIGFIRELLQSLPAGACRGAAPAAETLQPDSIAASLIEGWRGEVCHVAVTDAQGRFDRYKIVDPSFHNWPALARVLRGQEISDFPLCNKSFNLSYCGHDL